MRPGWGVLAGAIALALASPAVAQGGAATEAGSQAEATAQAQREAGLSAYAANDYPAALRHFRDALETAEAGLGPDHVLTAIILNDIGVTLENTSDFAGAEAVWRRMLESQWTDPERFLEDRLAVLTGLGRAVHFQNRYDESREIFAGAIALAQASDRPASHQLLNLMDNYSGMLRSAGQVREANAVISEARELARSSLPEDDYLHLQLAASHATVMQALGNLDDAATLFSELLPALEGSIGQLHPTYLSVLNRYALTLWSLGRLEEAELRATQLLELVQQGPYENSPLAINALANYAAILRDQQQQLEALPLMQQALARFEQVETDPSISYLAHRQTLGHIYQDLGRDDQAYLTYKDGLELLIERAGDRHPETIAARNNFATLLLQLEDYEQAEPLLADAVRINTEVLGEGHPSTLLYMANHALALQMLGRTEDAAAAHYRNVELRRENLGDLHPMTLLGAANHAYFYLRATQVPEEAFPPARFALAGFRQRRSLLGDDPASMAQLERENASQDYYFNLMANASWEAMRGRPNTEQQYEEHAFSALQELLSGATTSAIARSAARRAADSSAGLGDLALQRQDLADQWLQTDLDLTAILGETGPAAQASQARLRETRAALTEQISTIDERLRSEAPEYFALVRPEPMAIAEAAAMLRDDEAVLMLVPTTFGTHVVALTNEGFAWTRSGATTADVSSLVRRLQYDIGMPVQRSLAEDNTWADENAAADGRAFSFAAAHGLYRQLVEPAVELIGDRTHVFVMGAGPLSGLSLGLLVTEPVAESGNATEDLRAAQWLADRYALVTVPSLQSIQFLRTAVREQDESVRPFIGFGNPVLQGNASARGGRGGAVPASRGFNGLMQSAGATTRGTRGIANVEDLRTLASLPGTETELQALWQAFGEPDNALFLADAAREAVVKQADLDAEVVVFATHGLLAGEVGGLAEPGLVLTPPDQPTFADDGYLSMSEIAEMRIDADWVILSACNTAGSDGSEDSTGLSGLARAFFYAGAQNLLVSHWPVRDDVAAELTVRTVQIAGENPGLSRAQAFQQAMAEIRNDPDHPEWAHPEAWAPFVLVGDR